MRARHILLRIACTGCLAAACTVGGGDNDGLSGSAGAPTGGADTTGVAASSESVGDASTAEGGADAADSDPSGAEASSGSPADSSGGSDDGPTTEDSTTGTTASEDSSSSGEPSDLDDGILDITVVAHDDCTFTTMPASISVPEGTEFTVNWISAATSDIEFDIAKIDQFNQVPIVIGMEPATSYHDEVRVWCGQLFTGTFDFRVMSCFDPHYIPVDCSG
jgi:hypothetical protein